MKITAFAQLALATATLVASPAFATEAPGGQAPPQTVPDWSGVWQMVGNTVFDRATVEPNAAGAGTPGTRERPPFNAKWEAKYLANIEKVKTDRFPDPVTTCGTPHGMPRALNVPDAYEFVATPKQTWLLMENGPNIIRVYTDGRSHLGPDDIWPTYSGDSVGHWEGDTLVFDTIGLKGEDGTIVDRTGIVLSSKAHVMTRMRRLDQNTMQADITVEDPEALTRPWSVTKQYRRLEGDIRVMDYACAENNRNPVSATGKTLTLGTDGKPIDIDR